MTNAALADARASDTLAQRTLPNSTIEVRSFQGDR